MNTLSYALLGALSTKARTGWELAQHMKSPIAYMWTAQHSQIYPELIRLAGHKLVRATVIPGRGPRDTKRYAITATGRRALTLWADSPLPPEAARSEMLLRIRALWLVSPDQAIAFVATRRQSFAEQLAQLGQEKAGFAPDDLIAADHPEFFAYATLQYGLTIQRAGLAWCDWLLGQLHRHRNGETTTILASEPLRDVPAGANKPEPRTITTR